MGAIDHGSVDADGRIGRDLAAREVRGVMLQYASPFLMALRDVVQGQAAGDVGSRERVPSDPSSGAGR
jgi:hypothetical protein